MVTIEGNDRETLFDGVVRQRHQGRDGSLRAEEPPVDRAAPKRLEFDHINVVNTGGDLVRVERCDVVSVEGTGLGSVGGRIINNRAGSGLSRHYVHEKGINSPAGKGSGLGGRARPVAARRRPGHLVASAHRGRESGTTTVPVAVVASSGGSRTSAAPGRSAVRRRGRRRAR